MKKLFETVKAWLRSRVTAMKSEKGRMKSEKVKGNGLKIKGKREIFNSQLAVSTILCK